MISIACALFVSLAEEGWVRGPVTEAAVEAYLRPLLSSAEGTPEIDALVLGCTHFPVLRGAVEEFLGPNVTVVDSAVTTAQVVSSQLASLGLNTADFRGQVRFLATDEPVRFAQVGRFFIGQPLSAADVERIDL